jgi:hypothetical protein
MGNSAGVLTLLYSKAAASGFKFSFYAVLQLDVSPLIQVQRTTAKRSEVRFRQSSIDLCSVLCSFYSITEALHYVDYRSLQAKRVVSAGSVLYFLNISWIEPPTSKPNDSQSIATNNCLLFLQSRRWQ